MFIERHEFPISGAAAMPNAQMDCVREAYDLSRLPWLTHGRRQSASSCDKSGGGRDCDRYLYSDSEGDAQILLDAQGPGCVYRMFFATSERPGPALRVYVDGNPVPVVQGTLSELLGGGHPAFPPPLVGCAGPDGDAAYVSYVPMPFQHRITVAAHHPAPALRYDIDYAVYPPNMKVVCYRPDQDNSAIAEAFSRPAVPGDLYERGQLHLKPGAEATLCTVESAYTQISALRLKLDGLARSSPRGESALNSLRLTARFDGEALPSIDAALSCAFALPDCRRAGLYPAGMDGEGWLYLHLPMPFEDRAELKLSAPGDAEPMALEYEVYTQPLDASGRFGRLNIRQISYETRADVKDDTRLLCAGGFGKLVGVVRRAESGGGGERIYIDDSKSPQVSGTGACDFFNAPCRGPEAAYSGPLYGGIAGGAACRFLVGDAVPFGRSLHFDIARDPADDRTEKGEVALFYYADPHSALVASDEMEVFGERDDHGLRVEGPCQASLCRSQYEGARNGPVVSERGALLYRGGYMTFTMKLCAHCTGAILRRRFEYSFPNQSAHVWVDGEYTGVWYDAGCNPVMRLKESEFLLPEMAVRNKRSLEVRVEAVSPIWSAGSCRLDAFITPPRHGASAAGARRRRYASLFEQFQQLLSERITKKLTVESFTAELCVSASHLRRVVQLNAGCSFSECINRQKIEYAKLLITQSDVTVGYIAKLLKFSDAGYFFRLFKKYTGQTCGEYRASQTNLIKK